jgi:hypothetical protein
MTNASDQNGYDILLRLNAIATRAELIERLLALPSPVLASIIAAEPGFYTAVAADAAESADYLRSLARDFTNIAERISAVGGAK